MAQEQFENVDLFDMDASNETLNVFDQKQRNQDGLYRPSLSDATDKSRGYRAKIRFLPNVLENGKPGAPAIEKHIHYANFKNEPGLSGYYDCKKNYEDKCPLCTQYWALYNSKNQADVERSKLISRTTKYYSYILVLEDEQHPELVGQILVYPYGYTIKEKIKAERDGEIDDPCNIFDLSKGKDLQLIIKEKGGFPNYEASQFINQGPVKLYDEENKKFVKVPIDEEGKISDAKVKKKIVKFLTEDRKVNIDDYAPKEWDEETEGKVNDIIAILSGKEVAITERAARNTSSDMSDITEVTENFEDDEEITSDNFFNDDDDE